MAVGMSGKVAGMVWEIDVPHSHAWVLMSLADHAEHDGSQVYPGNALTAWKTGLSVRQVKRIVSSLWHEYGLLEPVKGGGGASPTEWRICIEEFHKYKKAPPKQRGRPEKKTGDTMSPVTPEQKPVTPEQKPVTSTRACVEPSLEPSSKSSVVGEETNVERKMCFPDDVTSRCLLLLSEIKGFPRDNAENALKLAEYRQEYPSVDAEEVVGDFAAWVSEKPFKKGDKPRLKLRNFFKSADKRTSNVVPIKQKGRAHPKHSSLPEHEQWKETANSRLTNFTSVSEEEARKRAREILENA